MISSNSQRAMAKQVAKQLLARLESHPAGLNAKVWRAYPRGGWADYRRAIAEMGNPPDQIARFEGAGIILQPKQLEFAAWARRLDTAEHIEDEQGTPELGFGGAKGPGKSFVSFAQAAVDDCQRYPGLKFLYLRKTGKRAMEQIEDLVGSVLATPPHTYTRGRVRFPNGSQIIIGHFNTEKEAMNYAGLEYDGILIEESTTLTEKARRAIRQSARTSKVGWRPRLYHTTNPLGVGHADFKKRFIDHERKYAGIENRTRKFIFARVDDNQFVDPDYRGNLEELHGAEKRAYLDGDWDVSAGAYFDQWQYEVNTVEPFDPPMSWSFWLSMDYGLNHWNVIQLHAKSGDGIRYTFAELAHRKYYPAEIAADLQAKLARYGIARHRIERFVVGTDVFAKTGAAEKSIAEQYAGLGFRMTAAKTGPGSRVAGAHHLMKLLGNPERDIAPQWFITRNCERLINTLPMLERDPNRPEDVLKVDISDDGSGGDDDYDAARHGLYGHEVKPISAETRRYA